MAKSEEKKHDVVIHWFRNGLRFHDNPCLLDACQKSESLLPIYVVDPEFPFAQTAGCRAGTIRANFLLESINEVDEKLRKMGSQLVVVLGKSHEVLPEIVATTQAKALFYEQEAAAPVREQDAETIQAIKTRLKRDGKNYECKFEAYATHTLHPMERYLAQCKDHTAPSTYGSFTKIFNKMSVAKEVNEVKEVPSLPNKSVKLLETSFAEALRMPMLEDLGYTAAADDMKNSGKGGYAFAGGENAAIELLAKNMARSQWVATFEKPKTSPNDATRPSTTALSPYVKHGCISPRRFYHELSKVYSKYNSKEISKPPVSLHGQLMWRDFNYLVGYRYDCCLHNMKYSLYV
jgi:cryptochrome